MFWLILNDTVSFKCLQSTTYCAWFQDSYWPRTLLTGRSYRNHLSCSILARRSLSNNYADISPSFLNIYRHLVDLLSYWRVRQPVPRT